MSALLWCKEITLVLFIGVSSNSNEDCEIISICRTECMTIGPNYHCYSRGLIEVPSFPESTVLLDLSDNAIVLNSDTFADYVNVYLMDLSTNNLTSVPDAVFRNNVALETLDMSNNYLTSVHADVFKNNVELVHLDLSNNHLTSVPDAVFKNNVALSRLYIYENFLTTLPLNLFSSNVDLQDLFLDNNKLTSVPGDVFINNVALTSLTIQGNSLTTLPLNVFFSNVDLEHLNLADNKLTSVPGDVFRNNVALTFLTIEGNSLTTLPLNVFSSNVDLEHLDLSNNNLTSLPDGVFENNVALTIIDCRECFDCDCLSASTYKWIIKIVKDPNRYKFTCRNGVSLPNTDFNCSADGSHLAVNKIQNESTCYCKEFISMITSSIVSMDRTIDTTPALESTIDKVKHNTKTNDEGSRLGVTRTHNESMSNSIKSITMKSSSMDLTIETTRPIESAIDKVTHKTKTNDSSFTYIAVILSGMAASITIITALTALRSFINKTSRIAHLDLADIQDDTIIDAMNFVITMNCNEQMDKKYTNIAPRSHTILS